MTVRRGIACAGLLFACMVSMGMKEVGASACSSCLTPESVADLELIQNRLKKALPAALKVVVSLETSEKQGSGVVVDSNGTVYTAAHVVLPIGRDRRCTIVGEKGEAIDAILIAEDEETDAAIVRVDSRKFGKSGRGKRPFAQGVLTMPQVGEWVFALGHAGGYDAVRGVVVRLGRVVSVKNGVIQTDCKLIGGDSGGGLFNLRGELLGIHSKIGTGLDDNVHIPVSTFRMMEKRR